MRLILSALFNGLVLTITPLYAILILICRPFGFRGAWIWSKAWTLTLISLLRIMCGIRVEVEGKEYLPDEACVVMSKHQSSWETIAMPRLVPPFVWVLKRDLFYVPLFGWALWALDSIGIRRANPHEALKQVIEQGTKLLKKGRWVVIFPEGHRQQPGATGNYHASGAMLAKRAGVGILPLAHNAGRVWSRRSFVKTPGVIRARFLPFIPAEEVAALSRNELLEKVKDQIETATRELGG